MEKHLHQFHDRWNRSIPELIYHKLGHGAVIFNTDKTVKKKFQFGTTFKALLFVERRYDELGDGTRDEYLSMVSFYPPRENQIEDTKYAIARYDSGNLRLCQVRTKASAAAVDAPAVAPSPVAAKVAQADTAAQVSAAARLEIPAPKQIEP